MLARLQRLIFRSHPFCTWGGSLSAQGWPANFVLGLCRFAGLTSLSRDSRGRIDEYSDALLEV